MNVEILNSKTAYVSWAPFVKKSVSEYNIELHVGTELNKSYQIINATSHIING